MSKHDQCPSSAKEGKPVHSSSNGVSPGAVDVASRRAEAVGTVAGRKYWRGLEDAADTREFRDWLEREFPAGASELESASELGQETRRHFLKIMGAGLALAGAATIPACRRPVHNILPYAAKVPEDVIPGKALFFATSMPLPMGGAEGLLAETHTGRPTKLEGNPLHPINQGKSSLWSQAAILSLYDPDRLKSPELVRAGTGSGAGSGSGEPIEATWDDFAAWSKQHFAGADADQGAGLAFVVDKSGGPARESMKAAVKKRWPRAAWVAYDALEDAGKAAALASVFGPGTRELLDLSKVKVIVSLDRDALNLEGGSLAFARQFAAGRAVMKVTDEMNRLYCAESGFSSTGASADHRLSLKPSQISALLVAIADRLSAGDRTLAQAVASIKGKFKLSGPEAGFEATWVEAVCEDLLAAKGASLVMVGATQPAWAHALGVLVNAALGNIGQGVRYAGAFGDAGSDGAKGLGELARAIDAGQVKTIVCLNVNPCFNVHGFEERFAKVPTRITLSNDLDETSSASTWRLNSATFLESWGDCVAVDGTVSPIQPMIAPLYGGKSEVEMLAIIAGEKVTDGYELTRNAWRAAVKAPDFEKAWRRALFDGVLAGVSLGGGPATLSAARAAELVTTATPGGGAEGLEAVFLATPMHDGRWANNAWLSELPDTVARVVWDNPAMISPATAKSLGLVAQDYTDSKPSGELVEVVLQGPGIVQNTLKIAAWVVPGIAPGVVVLPLGMGRRVTGLVGTGVGFDTFGVKPLGAFVAGATLRKLGSRYKISSTQMHGSMEGRAIVREMDLAAYRKHGGGPVESQKDSYGRLSRLSLAERLEGGEMTHMPALVSAYENPYNASKADLNPAPTGPVYDPRRAGKDGGFGGKPAFAVSPQWGMSVDLASCIGCNVCTVACQAENNIPVVGKIEVNKGREMQWIRVDRYFTGRGEAGAPEGMVFQPVACVHCENAPCEVVCPVNATVHGPEGHNYMVYNRCIGTRYCANNCPYKVRRFNFFEYGVTKFNGGLDDGIRENTPEILSENLPANQNLVPPRLLKKLDEIAKLQKNPNVTVRSRGVMEKCTYCIQRTNEAKIELKIKGLRKNDEGVPDGYVQTACQQACPTGAIRFGDILDTKSKVFEAREHHRTYALLGYLNVRPRTTYMTRVNNPNPKLRAPVADPFGHGHGAEHGGEHGKKEAGHTFFDRSKLHGEDGYRLSLSVLGGQA
jgi:molybdopterin-containing oxidoreductase family iron-sulfur binding subunit